VCSTACHPPRGLRSIRTEREYRVQLGGPVYLQCCCPDIYVLRMLMVHETKGEREPLLQPRRVHV